MSKAEGQNLMGRWEIEAWGDQGRQQDVPGGLPSPIGLLNLRGLLLSLGRSCWEEGGNNRSVENVTRAGLLSWPFRPGQKQGW